MEEAAFMVGGGGRMNGGMDESNGGDGRRDLGKDAEREEEGEGKRLKNRMRRGITGMRGWKKLL
jgi:hypothetical protein